MNMASGAVPARKRQPWPTTSDAATPRPAPNPAGAHVEEAYMAEAVALRTLLPAFRLVTG
jgi:hypothetical protein